MKHNGCDPVTAVQDQFGNEWDDSRCPNKGYWGRRYHTNSGRNRSPPRPDVITTVLQSMMGMLPLPQAAAIVSGGFV